ncbi:uncharacterized protein LOC124632273 isoform X1 [Helicoverpa zea]|uniref:uncharacterized protein LOC124632273 isoform X1 n=1 Tax=Helicoverpa zea TaxID=7113 RepID=UPI001F568590|nr:uncharacterized protein LOC124632273 isoform X1 [Helicoverpa zea]
MYATSTASTTTSGSGRAVGAVAGDRRVRAVRLVRPRRTAPAFGFALRGGREYATGFFISKVDFNSEAHVQGLKVGDQVVSVNGYRVDDAVHAELVHYLAAQSRLKIKVRHVGMLPVKDKAHEPLSWQFVSERASLSSDVSSSPTLCHDNERLTDLRLSILVPPRAKLGCGICKGPEWKPGIFVQFVREGGIAREAGLRPGDQILSCNGLDFSNVTFNQAISAMKATGRLELVVREGAGTDLVSPESSGYNSSASSAAGERSPAPTAPHVPLAPPAALRRRLASVAEEAADRADRLTMNRLKRRTWDSLDFDWKNDDIHNFDAPSDIEPDYDCPSIPNNPHSYENKSNLRSKNKKEYVTSPSNRTIINLTEDGATIQCSYDNQSPRKNAFTANHTNRDNDKKTIVVEVHHTSTTTCGKNACSYPPPLKNDCNSDSVSLSSSATLSSAIAEEIQRRMMNKKKSNPDCNAPPPPAKKPPPPKPADDKKKQHDALMDEFKKVHRKMFASIENNEKNTQNNEDESLDRQQTLPLRKADQPAEITNGNHEPPKREATDNPPPPPPMPSMNGHQNGTHKIIENKDKPVPKPITAELLTNSNFRKNNNLTRTPTPDYSKKTEPAPQIKSIKDEKADMESLESYKLKNPSNVLPKPPSNYFVKAPNGTATMKKHSRPVSVTIGEYAYGGASRREPTKLDFLNGDKTDGVHKADEEVSISNRLQSELALTLSRSNLRKKTEALDHGNVTRSLNVNEDSDASVDKIFHVRYGHNLLPLPPCITIPKVSVSKIKS